MSRFETKRISLLVAVLVLLLCLKATAEEGGENTPRTAGTAPMAEATERVAARAAAARLPGTTARQLTREQKAGSAEWKPAASQAGSRSELFLERFESGVIPPTGWSAIVNNAFTWESDNFASFEGAYHATCQYDEYYTGFQDEWLISPGIDLTTDGLGWKLDFWWRGSYYWSVSPWNSCDLIVKISIDGGTSWTDLWTEHDYGDFTSWEWCNTILDLGAYLTQTDVRLAFVYSGYDGAEFSIDAVSINDAAPPVGRCCYGDSLSPSCADVTETDCVALDGNWERYKNCLDHPCPIYYPPPPNDDWVNAEPIVGPFPDTVTGTTQGATVDCPSLFGWNAVWYVFQTPYAFNDVDIDYCGSVPGLGNIGSILFRDSVVCDQFISRTGYEWHDCGDGESNPHLWWTSLPGPATYYLPVYTGNGDGQQPFAFTIDFTETPPPPMGDYCGDPIVLNIGLASLPYTLTDQYTCGRDDWYNNTCLDWYDRGEDIIYQLNLFADVHLNILLDPKSTNYTGILIDATCPPDPVACIATSTNTEADAHGIINVDLTASTYYIMVDTWASPDCIPSFDLTIEEYIVTPGNDCGNPAVVKLPDDMTGGPDNDSYIDQNQSTCGRKDDYDNTCLGNWDRQEDIIYRLDVADTVEINIFLDPGPTDWTGILIDDNCPPDETDCIQYSTIGLGAHGLYDLTLEPGTYYIMIDINSSLNCIESFDLTIRPVGSGPENDNWENCMTVGNVAGLAFSTKQASPDGPGGCLTSPNLWYCYTATCTGLTTISLCGSSYDTKLAVYDGTDPYVAVLLGCDDNACGQQSELEVDLVAGNTYLIEVGGWSNYTGDGILSISCTAYCDASGECNNEYISHVTLGNIDNGSGCDDGGYSDYTTLATTIESDQTYPITVGIANGNVSSVGAVWIDWNQNGGFDVDEDVTLDVGTGAGPYSGIVAPPTDALAGTTRMRVRLGDDLYPSPCDATVHGEVEDYTIIVNVTYICGDADGNQLVNIADVVYLISYIFGGGPPPNPLISGDVDCDAMVNIADVVYLINYIFGGGPEPCAACP
ncbi:MAG: dockerin type I repeat-containing protein [candidate division Zixibacteria bacterium]|nr:dockerin type I repeat-containing protein [candidate division Zixibacteria bacterium]